MAGMRVGFPSVKAYLKAFVLGTIDYDQERANLADYGRGRDITVVDYWNRAQPYKILDALHGLTVLANEKYWQAIHAALRGQLEWETTWRQAVAYDYWAVRVHYAWHWHMLPRFRNGEVEAKVCMMFWRHVGVLIGHCLVLGWFGFARELAQIADVAFREGFFADDAPERLCRRVQYFVLRLWGDWQGWVPGVTEPCAPDPAYGALLKSWRHAEAAAISDSLLAACDRHTHVARYDNNREYFDLSNNATWYTPFEILSVLRLREGLGLPLPVLDHPLMKTPLGQLPAVTEAYSDSVLTSVLSRMAPQLPELKLA